MIKYLRFKPSYISILLIFFSFLPTFDAQAALATLHSYCIVKSDNPDGGLVNVVQGTGSAGEYQEGICIRNSGKTVY